MGNLKSIINMTINTKIDMFALSVLEEKKIL